MRAPTPRLLTPNVIAAVADAGLTMADLDAVVVGCGPGPFTGLRVGMATAAAYGHALGVPVYGVCSLDAIGVLTTGDVLVVTDARRREVYWARYRDGVRIDGPGVSAAADVPIGDAERVAGSPEHAGPVRTARHRAPLPDTGRAGRRRRRIGPASRRRWCRCICAGPTPRRSPSGDPAMTVSYGPLRKNDAARCAELEALLFEGDDPWPDIAFVRELAAPHNRYVAARVDDKLVGYAGISRLGRTPPFEYEIHTIGVDPAYQGQGIGRRMMTELLDYAGADSGGLSGGPYRQRAGDRALHQPRVRHGRAAQALLPGQRRRRLHDAAGRIMNIPIRFAPARRP